MKQICPICEKEKETVGPKLVGKTKTEDPRLTRPVDTLITKIMCKECYEETERN